MREIDFRKRLGRAIAAARLSSGLAQEGLAEKAGISRNELSLVERGEVTCSVWIAVEIAHGLGLGVDTLVGRAKHPPSEGELRLAEVVQTLEPSDADRAAQILKLAFGKGEVPRAYPKRRRV